MERYFRVVRVNLEYNNFLLGEVARFVKERAPLNTLYLDFSKASAGFKQKLKLIDYKIYLPSDNVEEVELIDGKWIRKESTQ